MDWSGVIFYLWCHLDCGFLSAQIVCNKLPERSCKSGAQGTLKKILVNKYSFLGDRGSDFEWKEILAASQGHLVSYVSRSVEQSERRDERQRFNQPVVLSWCSAVTQKLSQWTPQSLMSVYALVSWNWQRERKRERESEWKLQFLKASDPMWPQLCSPCSEFLNVCMCPCVIVCVK